MDSLPFAAGFVIIAVLIIVGIFLIPFIFYLLTLQNTLKAIAPQNRRMPPVNVWLSLIPVFNLVWNFIQAAHIADSISAELTMRGQPANERPTYSLGLVLSILPLCGWIPVLGMFTSIAWLVCWIIYWVKVNEFKNQFLNEPFSPDKESSIFGGLNY